MTNETPKPIFEIPDTAKSRAFVARNPQFPDALLKQFDTANKCFGRDPRPKNHLEHTCFCERAVTIEYLVQNPQKVDRFLQFAAVQENRAMEAALKQIPQDQIDAAMGPENRVAETRKRYEQYKGNFKVTACSACGVKTPPTWDVDLVSMVHRVDEPYKKVFLLAYTIPNFKIHATLASATQHDETREEQDAETALIVATELFLCVMRSQNALFSLNLDADIEACTSELREAQARALSP